jgi:NADPH:quinone reductase-like Zn-dependent oxidoreductase
MKVAVLHGPRDLRIEDHPLETSNLGPHDIWVETGITPLKIGTAGGNYAGAERIPGASDFPRRLGDGNVGIVRGVGSEVARFEVGSRVVSRENHQSEYVTSEFGPTFKVPDGVDSEDAVFAHLYTLSSLCYRKAQLQSGETVAVVGLGVLGLGAVGLQRIVGLRPVTDE